MKRLAVWGYLLSSLLPTTILAQTVAPAGSGSLLVKAVPQTERKSKPQRVEEPEAELRRAPEIPDADTEPARTERSARGPRGNRGARGEHGPHINRPLGPSMRGLSH